MHNGLQADATKTKNSARTRNEENACLVYRTVYCIELLRNTAYNTDILVSVPDSLLHHNKGVLSSVHVTTILRIFLNISVFHQMQKYTK